MEHPPPPDKRELVHACVSCTHSPFQNRVDSHCTCRHTRWWILKQFSDVVCSPFVAVTFAANFIGDYMTSTVKAFIDLQYSICFYGSGAWRTLDMGYCKQNPWVPFFITLLPLTWRLLQCIRRFKDTNARMHLANCGKYATSILTV